MREAGPRPAAVTLTGQGNGQGEDVLMPDAASRPAKRGRPRRGPDPERFHEILDAAARIFLEKGYSATSIQDIADAVGILKGSLYHYVRSKEDFLHIIIKTVYDQALADIAAVVALDVEPLEKLAAFVRAHVVFAADHLTAYSIQIRELDQLGDERRDEIRAGGDAYLDALQGILEEGQAQGVVDKQLDARLAGIIIMGQLNAMTRWYSSSGRLPAAELGDVYAGMIVSSVASDGAADGEGGPEGLRRRFLRSF